MPLRLVTLGWTVKINKEVKNTAISTKSLWFALFPWAHSKCCCLPFNTKTQTSTHLSTSVLRPLSSMEATKFNFKLLELCLDGFALPYLSNLLWPCVLSHSKVLDVLNNKAEVPALQIDGAGPFSSVCFILYAFKSLVKSYWCWCVSGKHVKLHKNSIRKTAQTTSKNVFYNNTEFTFSNLLGKQNIIIHQKLINATQFSKFEQRRDKHWFGSVIILIPPTCSNYLKMSNCHSDSYSSVCRTLFQSLWSQSSNFPL